jgi:hypothetical protein
MEGIDIVKDMTTKVNVNVVQREHKGLVMAKH